MRDPQRMRRSRCHFVAQQPFAGSNAGSRGLALLVCCVAAFVGCSAPQLRSAKSSDGSTTSFATSYGQDTAVIAAHIPGCTSIVRHAVVVGTASNARVVSSCTFLGHTVVLYGWPDARSEHQATLLLGSGPPSYWSSGPGWTQIVGDNAPLAVQRDVAQVVARALSGSVANYP